MPTQSSSHRTRFSPITRKVVRGDAHGDHAVEFLAVAAQVGLLAQPLPDRATAVGGAHGPGHLEDDGVARTHRQGETLALRAGIDRPGGRGHGSHSVAYAIEADARWL